MTVDSTTLKKATMTQGLNTVAQIAQLDIDCTVTPLVSAQDYELFKLPKGAVVLNAAIVVRTGEGATETVDLGVTGALTQFFNDKSVETAGVSHGMAEAAVYFATAEIAVVLLANNNLGAAKFSVILEYAMVEAAQ